MLTASQLQSACYPKSFARGKKLLERPGAVDSCKLEHGYKDELVFSGRVLASGSFSNRYETSIYFTEEGELEAFACTCAAARNYEGFCKHAVALGLYYMQHVERFLPDVQPTQIDTSSALSDLMLKRRRGAQADILPGSVHLIPTLRGPEDWTLNFKITNGEFDYVVKNVTEFVRNVDELNYFKYGKKLAFTHCIGAFDEQSRQIIDYLKTYLSTRSLSGRFGSYYFGDIKRDLSLAEAELVDFLDIINPGKLCFVDNAYFQPEQTYDVEVGASIKRFDVDVEQSNSGGFAITCKNICNILIGNDKAYCFGAHRFDKQDSSVFECADFFQVLAQNGGHLYLGQADAALFAATYLPMIENCADLSVPDELVRLKQVPAQLEFFFDKDKDYVSISYHVKYGEIVLVPCKDPELGQQVPLRDDALERMAVNLVNEYFDGGDAIVLDDVDAVGDLIFGGLARFKALGEVFTTPAFDKMLFDKKPRLQIGLSIAGNLIDMDVSADDLTAPELAALLGSFRRKKKYHRLKSGAYVNWEDMEFSHVSSLIDDLGITQKQLMSGHFEIPAYRAFYIDAEFEDAIKAPSFKEYVARLKNVSELKFDLPQNLKGVLRPYQVEGFNWLCSLFEMGFGGILADEMGLGKSVQLISLLEAKKSSGELSGPAFIVCPASLVYNWLSEFEKFAPGFNVLILEGAAKDRMPLIKRSSYDVLIASYTILQKDIDELEAVNFSICVLDEAQYIKNHATLTARAAKRIKADHRLALTGTPVENRLSEVWSIFDFLMPGFLGSYELFRKRYEIEILGQNAEVAARLNSLISPFVLRRLKKNVLLDLPEKLEQVVYVPLFDKQRELYGASEQKLRIDIGKQKKANKGRAKYSNSNISRVEVLAELTRLRQIALDPSLVFENYSQGGAKAQAIVQLVEQAVDCGQKVLVFSQFTSYLDILEGEFAKKGISFYRIDGSTAKKQRVSLVNDFNSKNDVPLFLISLKAGGTGLNLTGASVVVHADPWWNLAATNQATDRAHRIGQEKDVSVYKVIAKGTIEERILKLQDAKADLADMVITEGGSAALSALTPDDLLELLSD